MTSAILLSFIGTLLLLVSTTGCGSGVKATADADGQPDAVLDVGDVTDVSGEDVPTEAEDASDTLEEETIEPDCSTGPCCDAGTFRPSTYECSVETEYRCSDTALCGADAQRRVVHTFCTGVNNTCIGAVVEDPWETLQECGDYWLCDTDETTYASCSFCAGGCSDDACVACTWQWRPMACCGTAPIAGHAAVWMPEYGKMFVYGGNPTHWMRGSLYNPVTDVWETTAEIGIDMQVPQAVWSGSRVYVVYGVDKIWYDPASNTTGRLPSGGINPIWRFSSVWTGSEMILWGGWNTDRRYEPAGSRYDPVTDTWTPTSEGTDCPEGRCCHSTVWTGSEMIIWGGRTDLSGGDRFDDGARYDPVTDTWQATSSSGLNYMYDHASVWAGSDMIIWGSPAGSSAPGATYDPGADTWGTISTGYGMPSNGRGPAVWTGEEMIVWGSGPTRDVGGHYNPTSDSWRFTATAGAPSRRTGYSLVWTGSEMILWGGYDDYTATLYDEGAKYRCVPD